MYQLLKSSTPWLRGCVSYRMYIQNTSAHHMYIHVHYRQRWLRHVSYTLFFGLFHSSFTEFFFSLLSFIFMLALDRHYYSMPHMPVSIIDGCLKRTKQKSRASIRFIRAFFSSHLSRSLRYTLKKVSWYHHQLFHCNCFCTKPTHTVLQLSEKFKEIDSYEFPKIQYANTKAVFSVQYPFSE